MATEGKAGLDYWIASDLYKQNNNINWEKVDVFVEKGWLTERDRDLLHALGSMAKAGFQPKDDPAFKDVFTTRTKLDKVTEEHKDDPLFSRDAKGEVEGPKHSPEPDGKGPHDKHKDPSKYKKEDPPPVPGGADGKNVGKDAVSVNTAALQKFAANMLALRDMISHSRGHLKDVNILPGAFPKGFQLRERVNGTSPATGLKGETDSYLHGLEIEFRQIQETVLKLVKEYDSVEKLNNLTADKLTAVMNEPFSYINNNTGKPK
ncbi:hypothetical protein [Actinosynnema sp. ALI-1.44]|uniref:hypothetical protein n=1 Tax=Actinosynnema sp. ALI-1.44 TaxID=1933779 RepID=UPI00097C5F2C|nr:hypothetical protein [Actinosynnema sp. ALI-1.44]